MTLTEVLKDALSSHDEEKVSELLDRIDTETVNEVYEIYEVYETDDSEPDFIDWEIWTPLLAAVFHKNVEAVTRLLAVPGIDVNIGDEREKTALHNACVDNKSEIVEKLLDVPGVDVNCLDAYRRTPLHDASKSNHIQVIAKLLAVPGIEVNLRDYHGKTPILEAAERGRNAALEMLLNDSRVDIDIKNEDGKGLEELVPRRKVKCLETIMRARRVRGGGNDQENNDRPDSMALLGKLINAIKSDDAQKVTECLDTIGSITVNELMKFGNFMLHVACVYGNIEAVNGLLSIPGIDINGADVDKRAPLHDACAKNHSEIVAKLLAAPGINANVKDWCGRTPLHFACYKNHSEIVTQLLDVPNIDVNFKDETGRTPLHLACSTNHFRVVSKLLAKRKNIEFDQLNSRLRDKLKTMKNIMNQMPADITSMNVDEMAVLSKFKNASRSSNQILGDVTNTDEEEVAALFDACAENHIRIVSKLLAAPDINVNSTNEDGKTPLHLACSMNHSKGDAELVVVKMLLNDSRVDLNAKDRFGKGLEDLVSKREGECWEMIKEARRERDLTRKQEQTSHDDTGDPVGNELENLRAKVRKQYIDKIDKTNDDIKTEKLRLRISAETKEREMKDLNEKKDLEKNSVETKLALEKTKLEQKKAELEEQLQNVDQRLLQIEQMKVSKTDLIEKSHGEEVIKLNEKYKEDELTQKLDNMIEIRSQLTRDLNNFEASLSDKSLKDTDSLEAARRNLECPVCMETMRPPTRIWMCLAKHLVCEPCKDQLEGRKCPICRTGKIEERSLLAENFSRSIFMI